ncbi:MAG TPA: M56 family metallopeptidase [Candidatus Bathyarchaeia archaeon]|nr:M56 family metallopeptidase [Candidatus Bathyarchaeia archaeon]
MVLPYYLRLLCLCAAAFFVVHAVAWLAIRSVSATSVRVAGTMRPGQAARLLFWLRIAPASVTLFLVIGFCIPSYVWLEPDWAGERVGWLCLTAAALGAATWLIAVVRGSVALTRTRLYLRNCRSSEQPANVEFPYVDDVMVLDEGVAVMAVTGVVRPRLVVSRAVLDTLSEEQKIAAFRHEEAHRSSRDNLKRLLFLLTPDVLPFARGLSPMERGWAKYSEWAADDAAVDGSQDRALSLASALVKVAKLGLHAAPCYVLSSLMDDNRELQVRVDRLLREPAYAERPLQPLAAFALRAGVICGSIGVTLLLWPQSLGGIHRLLERLVQ